MRIGRSPLHASRHFDQVTPPDESHDHMGDSHILPSPLWHRESKLSDARRMATAEQLNRERAAYEMPGEFDAALFAVGLERRVDIVGETDRKATIRFSGEKGTREIDKTDLHGEFVRWEEWKGALFRVVLELEGARLLWLCDRALARRLQFHERRDGKFVRWIDGPVVAAPITSVYLAGIGGARVTRREGQTLVVARIVESDAPDEEASRLKGAGFTVRIEELRASENEVRRLVVANKRIER
jgi:hypothetical protein